LSVPVAPINPADPTIVTEVPFEADYKRLDAGVTLSGSFSPASWFDISPTLTLRETYWTQRLGTVTLDLPDASDTPSPTDVTLALDQSLNRPLVNVGLTLLGPKFFRTFEPPDGGRGSRFKSTIEPRVVYNYISDFEENDEIIVYDEIDPIPIDVSLLTYSVITRLMQRRPQPARRDAGPDDPVEYDGASEIASLELRQSVAFNRQLSTSVTLDDSSRFGPVSLIGRYNPTSAISTDLRLDWDILFNEMRSVSLTGTAHSARLGRVGLSYFLNRALEDLGIDTGTIRLNGGSALLQRRLGFDVEFAYNLATDQLQSQRYRLGYNTQCCGFTVEYLTRDFGLTEPDSQFRFTVSLTGVGTFIDMNSRLN